MNDYSTYRSFAFAVDGNGNVERLVEGPFTYYYWLRANLLVIENQDGTYESVKDRLNARRCNMTQDEVELLVTEHVRYASQQ